MKLKIAALCVLGFAAFNASAQMVPRAVPDVPPNTIRWESTTGAQAASANVMGNNSARMAQPSTAPLLTDRRTASSLQLPHTVLQGDIVMVPAEAAGKVRLPAVTVVPAASAGPAAQVSSSSTAVMGAGPAPLASKETVITEMRNPAVTIVQRGANVAITQ